MDYTPLATHLAKWQWDLASDPGIAQGVFDKDEDVMQRAKKEQINAALKYYNEFKLDQEKAKFKNIPAKVINFQVKQRLDSYGKPINQGKFFLCGPAAACYIAVYHDPEKYVKTIFDLYMYGQANDGKIKGNELIYNVLIDESGTIDGIQVVDWMLLHALRYSENFIDFGKYDPHIKDDFNKMTTRGEFEDLLTRLNISVSIEKQGSIKDTAWLKKEIIPWLIDSKILVLFINSDIYKHRNIERSWYDEFISENYGRHFITVDKIVLQKNKIQIHYWDYGGYSNVTFESYNEFKDATFRFWLIKNTSP
jgi:hypothetical protein